MDNSLTIIRSVILIVGWPILVTGSIYLIMRGRFVYRLVKGSLVGNVTKVLVISMLVEMYSLGAVSTMLMFCDIRGVYLVIPVFLFWFVFFIWSLKVLTSAASEAKKISQLQSDNHEENKTENQGN